MKKVTPRPYGVLMNILRDQVTSPQKGLGSGVARALKVMVAATASAAFVVATSAPAFGHVTVTPVTAAAGSTIDLAFRVPNESDSATTTKVEVVFPKENQPKLVDTPSHPGWTSNIDRSTGKVASVSWSGGTIAPRATDSFVATVSLPNDTPTYKLSVLQTYSDGKVSRWIDGQHEGDHEAGSPAPVLTLTGAVAPSTTTTAANSVSTTTTIANKSDKGMFSSAEILIAIGVGLFVAMLARMRRSMQKQQKK